MGDPLFDCSPLVSAAASGKLRLVRLLVEGGALVNGCNPEGETALLAVCKALRGGPPGPDTLKLLTFLLQNKANPNAQDAAGRTALMYACMERAGAQVASALLSAGADPSTEDHSGASALVYAINALHQPTVEVLMEACRARGRDIIIIATEVGVNGGQVTRRYLNVPPSPDASPVSCMSPSEIVLKTGSPDSPEGENIFDFRGAGGRGGSSSGRRPYGEPSPPSQGHTPPPRQRRLSEPWLAIHHLARLNRAYEEGMRDRGLQEGDGEDLRLERGGGGDERGEVEERTVLRGGNGHRGDMYHTGQEGFLPRVSPSLLSLVSKRCLVPGGSAMDQVTAKSSAHKLPVCPSPPHSPLRRNTLPSLVVVPAPLHLPPSESPPLSRQQVHGVSASPIQRLFSGGIRKTSSPPRARPRLAGLRPQEATASPLSAAGSEQRRAGQPRGPTGLRFISPSNNLLSPLKNLQMKQWAEYEDREEHCQHNQRTL